jgi:Predicted membrane protein
VASVAGPRVRTLDPGLRFASRRVLRLGIILLGARLSLAEIARIGLPATGLIVITMAASFAIVMLVARVVRVDSRLAVLIAVGSAVCGNTAIVATAPVIGARAREVAYAVATITLFGTLAVFLYPVIGRALALPQPSFGLWTGVAVHDTSQVIATGAAYGPRRSMLRRSSSSSATRSWRRSCSSSPRSGPRGAMRRSGRPGAASDARCPGSCSGSWRSPRCGRSD